MPKHIVVAAVLSALFISLLAAGCGGGGGGGTTDTTVFGVVLDSARADQPVPGARVEIGGASAVTGPDGSFTIRGAAIGASTAAVTPPGGEVQTIAFSPPIVRGTNGRFDLIINIGQVRGRVLAPDGQPAAGARVTVVITGESVMTGADGSFLIPNVPAGPTEITAVLGTGAVTRAITVRTGFTDVGDLRLVDDPNPNPPLPPRTIEGIISLGDGASPAGTLVRLMRDGVERERTTVGPDGGYGFYVPPGDYRVRASRQGYADAVAPVSVTNPAVAVRVDLRLNRS